ncbi:hypothetical protein GYH30_049588 [Glycine max]|nr:hypothetical protein GYH30_049588 [Glycine max]
MLKVTNLKPLTLTLLHSHLQALAQPHYQKRRNAKQSKHEGVFQVQKSSTQIWRLQCLFMQL